MSFLVETKRKGAFVSGPIPTQEEAQRIANEFEKTFQIKMIVRPCDPATRMVTSKWTLLELLKAIWIPEKERLNEKSE